MPSVTSLIPLLLPALLLLLSFCSMMVSSGQDQRVLSLNISSLLLSETCKTPQGTRNNSLKMSHSSGPCSPFGGNTTQIPAFYDLILGDERRMFYLKQRILNNASKGGGQNQSFPSQLSMPAKPGQMNCQFVITVGLGSPAAVNQTVLVDTGSDLCWVNCLPCLVRCHNQRDSLFDPSQSFSYRNVSCGSPLCSDVRYHSCLPGNVCQCEQRYGDGSKTTGIMSQDRLTLTPTDLVENFIFSCNNNSTGVISQETSAGLFGFGRGPLSLVSQISSKYGKSFSYCLPSNISSTGHLNFGPDARPQNIEITYTPMVNNSHVDSSFYSIGLSGVAVYGQLVDVKPTDFQPYGTIIDSGTAFSHLPPSVYNSVVASFKSKMTGYKLLPEEQYGKLTCYNFTGLATVTVPAVDLYIGNLILELGFTEIIDVFPSDKYIVGCLAFRPSGGIIPLAVLGYVQQRTYEVVYDFDNGQIGFGVGNCNV